MFSEKFGLDALWLRLSLNALAFAACVPPLAIAVAALSGVGHRWLDILAQFTAPALIAALALALACGILSLRGPVVAAGLSVLLLLFALSPQVFPSRGAPEPGAPTIRLYSANLWAWNTDTDAIARSISAADPDIIALVELGDAPMARIDHILADYPHRVITPTFRRPNGAVRSAIASRYPLTAIPNRNDGLEDVGAVVETPLGPLNVVAVHLTRPWPFQFQWAQINQAQAIADIRRDLIGPVIVAGDFNSVSSARIGHQMRRQAALIPAPGWPGTWPSSLPAFAGMTIDQVYRSPDLALLDRKVGRRTGSDHRPVVTEFTRAAP